MPQITDEDLLEIYASAPVDEYVLHTLELIHALFVDGAGNADSIRIALDERAWDLPMEVDAPLFAEQTKTFEPLAMQVTLPGQEEGRLGEMLLSIDNVPMQYQGHLSRAASQRSPVNVIYREYILNHNVSTGEYTVVNTDGPSYKVDGLTIKKVKATLLRLEAAAQFVDVLNNTAPRKTFDRDSYPSLFN